MNRNEADNVFKTLNEEPLVVVNPIACRFGFHRWQKWTYARKESYYLIQDRYCDSCGKYKRRNIGKHGA